MSTHLPTSSATIGHARSRLCEGILAIGGSSWHGAQNTVEVLNTSTTTTSSTTFANLPTIGLWGHVAFPLPNSPQFLVCGGKGRHHSPLPLHSCITFNYTSSSWSNHSTLLTARHHSAVATLPTGDTYLLGGAYSPTTTEVLRAGTGTWAPGPDLPYHAALFKGCAAPVNTTHLMTVGGGWLYTMVTVLSTTSGTWSTLPELAAGRRGHACAALGARVVVAGGYLFTQQQYTASTLLLDPSTGAAAPGPAMAIPRAYFALQQLPDRLLAIGGSTVWSYQRTVEVLAEGSGAWTAANTSLAIGRSTFATLACQALAPLP